MATKSAPNPDQRRVRLFGTERESEAMVVRGLLESESIDCEIRALDAPQEVLPIGGTVILVREEDAPRALQIIEEYRRTPEEEAQEDSADSADSGESSLSEDQQP